MYICTKEYEKIKKGGSMDRPSIELIRESIEYVDDVVKLRNTIIHLIDWIDSLEDLDTPAYT